MLVLTRKLVEAFIIEWPDGEQIDIFVTEVREGQINIGVDAPSEVGIWREELLNRAKLGLSAFRWEFYAERSTKKLVAIEELYY